MAGFFESALLFSLAVLIVLVGLLVYYFKGRLDDLEQKNMKCLEIIGDVYKAHLELKNSVHTEPMMSFGGAQNGFNPISMVIQPYETEINNYDEISEAEEIDDNELEQIELDENDFDTDDESIVYDESNTKKIKVDLSSVSGPECIDISDNDDSVDLPLEIETIDVTDSNSEINADFSADVKEPSTVVHKTEDAITIEPVYHNDEKRDYKKMTLPELRGYIISNGIQSDSSKLKAMKKGELIDLILAADAE